MAAIFLDAYHCREIRVGDHRPRAQGISKYNPSDGDNLECAGDIWWPTKALVEASDDPDNKRTEHTHNYHHESVSGGRAFRLG